MFGSGRVLLINPLFPLVLLSLLNVLVQSAKPPAAAPSPNAAHPAATSASAQKSTHPLSPASYLEELLKQRHQLQQQQEKLKEQLQQPKEPQGSYGYYYEPNSRGGMSSPSVFELDQLENGVGPLRVEAPESYAVDVEAGGGEAQDQDAEVDANLEDMMLQQEFGDLPNMEEQNNFFELPKTIGQTAGLAVDSQQYLILFHRSSRIWDSSSFTKDHHLNPSLGVIPNHTITVLDTTNGRVVAEHGENLFYMPHGLSLDAEGCLWVTDVGSHQVMKLDGKSFKPVLTLGEKLVPGNDEKHFCKPTDVAVAKNGDFFVADGYCNSRVMKFNKKGEFLTSFGAPNSGNPPKVGEFFVPHSLALIEDLNLLCVADRENERIQCFAAGLSEGMHHHPRAFVPTGTFFTKAENIGRVFAIREKQHYLVGVTNHDQSRQVDPQVFVMDMNTGRANTFAKGLENAHALALSDNGDIYVSQIEPNQIVKFSVPQSEEL